MDRLYYLDADIVLGPTITYYRGTRLYDGDSKTKFDGETVHLTDCHLHFTSASRPSLRLVLDLKCVLRLEEEPGGILRSSKIVLHLGPVENVRHPKPVARSTASHIKLSFSSSGLSHMVQEVSKVLSKQAWICQKAAPTVGPVIRSGITGIERKMQEKIQTTGANINVAFQDLKNLMDMAKDMVRIANAMSSKIKDRQGDISEDETIKYKSYLLSLGIDDPVTRNAFSSGDAYRKELAKQMVDMLLKPITKKTSWRGPP